ncbi:MAG: hypothetical protein K6U75_00410 [Firmicutes bacterium]|nr:hypothetical protein [Bacillota bacterium]
MSYFIPNLKCHIVRALAELGIAILYAHTPQAKGRVERLFRFFQDRLIKQMRLAGITDYTQANRFLQEQFLPWYNQQYTRCVPNRYRALPEEVDLPLVFSIWICDISNWELNVTRHW